MRRAWAGLAAVAAAGLGLGACQPEGLRPPTERGVCWHLITPRDGSAQRFNRVAANVDSLETCAARLEAIRLRFGAFGMRQETMTGAYQGRFLFLRPAGIYTATRLSERGYLVLVRTGDGRLAQQGAVRQPGQPAPTAQ